MGCSRLFNRHVYQIRGVYVTGIYKITNTVNGKCYIGQSTNLGKRIKKHIDTLLNGSNRNEHLQNAYNKYGAGCFTIEIIEECDENSLDEREIFWIDFYKSYDKDNGYNKTKGGTGGNGYLELYDEKELDAVSKKKSESVRGERNPIYGRHCYTNGLIIKYIKDDQIKSYEEQGWYKGVPDFVRQKEHNSNLGEKNGFFGKKHSEETLRKMSNVYIYDNKEFIGLRKLQKYLRANGYPKISSGTIAKLSNNISVKGYDDLLGKIACKNKGENDYEKKNHME